MYEFRFSEEAPVHRSIEQLRAMEGGRVKSLYQFLATQYGIKWRGRKFDPNNWDSGDMINRCLSSATSCLYGISEAAVLAAGYAPGIGFVHTGKQLSFVYDIADLFKFDTVVPIAFQIASRNVADPERAVRIACRDIFRKTQILTKIIPTIEEILAAGGLQRPTPCPENVPIAIPDKEQLDDDDHRS